MDDAILLATEPYINCSAPLTWGQIVLLLEYRLATARRSLESDTIGEQKANILRGEIRALKNLLDLPKEAARRVSAPLDAPY